jgi:hypothetical protein
MYLWQHEKTRERGEGKRNPGKREEEKHPRVVAPTDPSFLLTASGSCTL